MTKNMSFVIGVVDEASSAKTARIWTFIRMNSYVHIQFIFLRKRFPTIGKGAFEDFTQKRFDVKLLSNFNFFKSNLPSPE